MYKLPVGKIPNVPCCSKLNVLHYVSTQLFKSEHTIVEEKRRVLIVFSMVNIYVPEETQELLYRDAIAPHIPDGHELTERDGEWGIWPIKAESPIITILWPAWAAYAAMDSNGRWWFYEGWPEIDGFGWWGEKHKTEFHPSKVPAFNGDWKDSLVKNPNK